MASAFSHALVAITFGKSYAKKMGTTRFLILGSVCATIPDLDVVMLRFVAYSHPLGHRGFFHSLFFCLLLAAFVMLLFYRKQNLKKKEHAIYFLYFFLCGASHGLLDMLTNGGLGVAILAPFDNTRYFFPYTPIQVSPIGVGNFFSEWGLKVIKSELIWIALPCLIFIVLIRILRKTKKPLENS
ncbi:MAG: metal-dependent hydrolase [Bacteroidetes bacterium]|nr:metal-dependent hydrolase [Bacteroidota bacterium]